MYNVKKKLCCENNVYIRCKNMFCILYNLEMFVYFF